MSTARPRSVARRVRVRLGVLLAGVGLVSAAVAAPATAAPTRAATAASHQSTTVTFSGTNDWWL